MTQPAKTGPMQGGWVPSTSALIAALQDLKDEVNRSMDSVQVGGDLTRMLAKRYWIVTSIGGDAYDERHAP